MSPARCVSALAALAFAPLASGAQFTLAAPSGAGTFGHEVRMLPNGNFLVADPTARSGGIAVGAVHLYRPNGTRIASLRGATEGDGAQLRTVQLANGNALAVWPTFDLGEAEDIGAVTFLPADLGVEGVVDASNSLVGDLAGARTGESVLVLANGHYVVRSPGFSSVASLGGAVTWGDGTQGTVGRVGTDNSLFGAGNDDFVGSTLTALPNGNYVVGSPSWHAPGVGNVGAATWGDGDGGTVGAVSAENSLVGATLGDNVASQGITALVNGNYVVQSPSWRNASVRVGAATWGNGNGGTVGTVSASNSLVGSNAFDNIGASVTPLANGHYVVGSASWDNGAVDAAGCAVWSNGNGGTTGVVSAANALVGSAPGDLVSQQGIFALSNGNYVVFSANFTQGGTVVGAATWGDGEGGTVGAVDASNSFFGSPDAPPASVLPLANGHYLVADPGFARPGADDAGAVTWLSGDGPSTGSANTANSLVGAGAGDQIGETLLALPDGSYVVGAPHFDDGAAVDAGAVMHLPGDVPAVRTFSAADAWFGPNSNDLAGSQLLALADGTFAIGSPKLQVGALAVGALTVSTPARRTGAINVLNSRVGSTADDRVGLGPAATALADGDYVTTLSHYDRNGIDSGAVHLGDGTGDLAGPLDNRDTVFGNVPGPGVFRFAYDARRKQLVVGERAANRVVLLRRGEGTSSTVVQDGPDPSLPGQAVDVVVTVASATAPDIGRVVITASSGETCSDDSPSPTSRTTSDFACALVFATAGTRTISAEFLGDGRTFAFSGSGNEPHGVVVPQVFGDGFE